jgi:hypothetical protein
VKRTLTLRHIFQTTAVLLAVGLVLNAGLPTRGAVTVDLLSPSWMQDGSLQGADYGYALAGAGDVNDDGYADLLIGAAHETYINYRAGAAYLYLGSRSGLGSSPYWTAGGSESGEFFGAAVSGAGDLNCDGIDDIAIGAYRWKNDASTPDEGAVFVFYGSRTGLSTTPDWMQQSNQKDAQYGYTVAGAGDVNNDGCDDLLVGARWYDNEYNNEGAVFLYYGSPDGLSSTPAWTFYGGQNGAALGAALAGGFDANNDEIADLLIGAPYYDNGQQDEGRVLFFLGSPDGPGDTPDWYADGNQIDARFGFSVAGLADVNKDEYDEIAIGAPKAENPLGGDGMVYVFYGSGGIPSLQADWTGGLPLESTGYGSSISSGGDANGDGFGDLIVGANLYSNDQSAEGAIFIYTGGESGLSIEPMWKAEGNKADTEFGFATASAGDVDNNGCSDIAVGAPRYRLSTDPIGRAFVFLGRAAGESAFRLHLTLLQSAAP